MPEVQGGSACGPSTLWRSEVAVPGGETSFSLGCLVSLRVTLGCSFPTSWRSGMLVLVSSSDPWVAARPSGSLAGVREVASFLARSECVAVVAGCTCFERGCWFARAAFGFVVGLCIHVGVSRRLREPTYGVAFTGAWLWSAELVEGVLALLAVPLLLGCVLVVCPFLLGCVLVGCPLVVGVCAVLVVCLALCACAPLDTVLCSVGIFARAKQMLVCRVATLVERCDTCLWLLPALCWLFVNSGKVFLEFFSVGSGGELFAVVLWGFLELLVVVLVRFALRTVLACFCQFLCYLRVEDFVCPHGREVYFVSRALRAVPDGSLGSVPCVQCEAAPGVLLFGLLVQALFQCVFCLCLSCAWRANVVVALLKLLVFRVFCLCGSLVESPFRLALGHFRPLVSCGESFPLAMLFQLLVQLCCILLSFGACGSTLVRGVELSASGTPCAADALWLYHYRCGMAALLCLVIVCPGRTTRMIWVIAVASCAEPFSGVLWMTSWHFPRLPCLVRHSVCGEVVVLTTGKSWYDLVVPWHLLFLSDRTDLSGCRGTLDGRVLVAVGAAVALRGLPLVFLRRWSLVERPAARAEWERHRGSEEEVASSL
ncbi:hypothetical protein Taro_014770 [Colocasia esculenta]|uniref:Uncharacterized protein n=1 Tax=Colocasia esculenta TaxID=4460 RepID=A0A843UR59_COLES|nr:hypothetical protein [Colocasia esculenta]